LIIWLASFPRSGNLLLRQILFSSLGQRTYHLASGVNEINGDYSRRIETSLDKFIAEWSDSLECALVKTHEYPRDESPAIYVVRDGRATLASFLQFERRFSPEVPKTMLDLIVGNHHYGGWSDHYRAWHSRSAPTLTLRYEDLQNPPLSVLRQLASFIGYEGEIAEWVNPIAEWRARYPGIVGEGTTSWEPPEEWTEVCDAVFWCLHGELMRELRFEDPGEFGAAGVADFLREVLPVLVGAAARIRELERACGEKETEIRELAAACVERDAALGAAVDEVEAKEAMIRELAEVCDEREAALMAAVDAVNAKDRLIVELTQPR
jgi:hypothetical protein